MISTCMFGLGPEHQMVSRAEPLAAAKVGDARSVLLEQHIDAGSHQTGDQEEKNFLAHQMPAVPADYIPRGSPARAASRSNIDSDVAS
ncbi:MAG: hypothetical protein QM674_13175 [Burkholderiaceae bacterium]